MHPTPLFFVCVAAKGVADGTSACVASNGLTAVEKRDSLDVFGCVARKEVSGLAGYLMVHYNIWLTPVKGNFGSLFGNLGKAQPNWIPAIGIDSKSAALQTKAAAPGLERRRKKILTLMHTVLAITLDHFLQISHIFAVMGIILCWEENPEPKAALPTFTRQSPREECVRIGPEQLLKPMKRNSLMKCPSS